MKKIRLLWYIILLIGIPLIVNAKGSSEVNPRVFTFRLGMLLGDNSVAVDSHPSVQLSAGFEQEFRVYFKPIRNAFVYCLYFDELFNLMHFFPASKFYMQNNYVFMEVYEFPKNPVSCIPQKNDTFYIIAAADRLNILENLLDDFKKEKKQITKEVIVKRIWELLKDYESQALGLPPAHIISAAISGVIYRGDEQAELKATEIKSTKIFIQKVTFY